MQSFFLVKFHVMCTEKENSTALGNTMLQQLFVLFSCLVLALRHIFLSPLFVNNALHHLC